jgi:Zn-dependent alcohol dehydrogenase
VRAEGTLPNGQIRFSRNGDKVHHYSAVSSFSQYTVMMPSNLIKIDKDYPIDVAAMFGCAVVTGAGSIFNAAKVRPGDAVAILGLGGVGLNAVMAAKISGASRIIGIDINADKLALARDLGCTHTFQSTDSSLISKVREITDGGVDFAIEVSGSRAAMEITVEITRVGAEVVCVGVGQSDARYDYPHTRLVVEEKVIRGSHFGSGCPDHDIPRYLQFFGDGRMPVDRLKSGVIPLEDLNEALDRLLEGSAVRQIIVPHM